MGLPARPSRQERASSKHARRSSSLSGFERRSTLGSSPAACSSAPRSPARSPSTPALIADGRAVRRARRDRARPSQRTAAPIMCGKTGKTMLLRHPLDSRRRCTSRLSIVVMSPRPGRVTDVIPCRRSPSERHARHPRDARNSLSDGRSASATGLQGRPRLRATEAAPDPCRRGFETGAFVPSCRSPSSYSCIVVALVHALRRRPQRTVRQRDAFDRRAGETPTTTDGVRRRKTLSQPRSGRRCCRAAPDGRRASLKKTFLRKVDPTSKRSLVYHAWVTLSSTLLGFVFGTAAGHRDRRRSSCM
jgi:hypothetical protein